MTGAQKKPRRGGVKASAVLEGEAGGGTTASANSFHSLQPALPLGGVPVTNWTG